MPYIAKGIRPTLVPHSQVIPRTAGELNFQITELVLAYLEVQDKVSYMHLNDVLGALDGAKAEFYRRVVVPYEQQKIIDNGDLYDEVLEKIGAKK